MSTQVARGKQKLKIVFVAKLSKLKEDKFAVIIPKQHNDKVKNLHKHQVRIVLDDEI